MRNRAHLATSVLLLTLSIAPRLAAGAWPHNPGTNLALCTAPNFQDTPKIVSDGAGGAIVVWQDFRSGTGYDIFAQHLLASGAVDPAWPANGRALCTAANDQSAHTIVSDGAGGAIVAWEDYRGVSADIYAQHVLASGVVDPAWPVNGRALCTAVDGQRYAASVSDGAGGAIVTWADDRSGPFNSDIYAQRVLASGAVDPAWPADGRALCTAASNQSNPVIVSDGAEGAIVAWGDFRSGVSSDVYAQHVLGSGALDPAWPANGGAVSTAANLQWFPTIASDGAGGAIVAWQDYRSGTNYDVYAQRMMASGVVDAAWPLNGRALCTAAGDQGSQAPGSQPITSDGAGGAIVAWQDPRSGAGYDIYAQHVHASGVVDPAWPVDGSTVCNGSGDQVSPTILSDGAAGAVLAWHDLRTGSADIYAHHVLFSGAVDPAWPANGRALSIAASNQYVPTLVSDGAGGAIVTWQDNRSGNYDIFAQRVARFGVLGAPEPVIASVRDVPNDQGGRVNVAWTASWLDTDPSAIVDHYWVLRSLTQTAAAHALARGERVFRLGEAAVAEGPRLVSIDATSTYYWEYLATVNALHFVDGYGYVAPTTGDSTGANNPPTYLMVVAFNAQGTQYWPSAPDSGYSVDNLSPAIPAPLTGNYQAGATHLHWNPNTEPDLASYRLYRGNSADFVPGPDNLIASPPDTGYSFTGAAGSYYKLSAVDVHGNESGFALLTPNATTGVPPGVTPGVISLSAPRPNPALGDVELRFTLPSEGPASVAIYDAGGRRTRTLVEGRQPAGERALTWDLRDDGGQRVPPGLYFVRLEAQGRVLVHKVATVN